MGRKLILPTLAVVAITAFMAFGLPAIDKSIPAIEFEPGAAQAVRNQIEFMPGAWGGSADELLTSILNDYSDYHTEGDRKSFTMPSGLDRCNE